MHECWKRQVCLPGSERRRSGQRQEQRDRDQEDWSTERCEHSHTGSHLSQHTCLDRWMPSSHTGKHFTVTGSQEGAQPRSPSLSLCLLRGAVPTQTAIMSFIPSCALWKKKNCTVCKWSNKLEPPRLLRLRQSSFTLLRRHQQRATVLVRTWEQGDSSQVSELPPGLKCHLQAPCWTWPLTPLFR